MLLSVPFLISTLWSWDGDTRIRFLSISVSCFSPSALSLSLLIDYLLCEIHQVQTFRLLVYTTETQ